MGLLVDSPAADAALLGPVGMLWRPPLVGTTQPAGPTRRRPTPSRLSSSRGRPRHPVRPAGPQPTAWGLAARGPARRCGDGQSRDGGPRPGALVGLVSHRGGGGRWVSSNTSAAPSLGHSGALPTRLGPTEQCSGSSQKWLDLTNAFESLPSAERKPGTALIWCHSISSHWNIHFLKNETGSKWMAVAQPLVVLRRLFIWK